MTDVQPDPGRTRGFLRRHAVLILATTTLVTCGALGYAAIQKPTYTAHARVLVEALTVPTAVARTPDMGTEQAVVTSSAVLLSAAHALNLPLDTVDHAVGVSVPVTANVLDISYSASDRTVARNGATAVANSYMAYRERTSPSNPTQSPDALGVPGVQTRLITPATRPANPSAPDVVIDLIAGLVVGLVVGTALAFIVDRYGQRLRSMTRWQDAVGVPVLVGLRSEPKGSDAKPTENDAIALRYLRMRIAHTLPARGAVLLVTEVRTQAGRTALARHLTGAFIDSGRSAVLVEMTQDHVALPTDTDPYPGDLRVRVSVASGFGAEPRPVGEWHAATVEGVLGTIEQHRTRHDVVVVTAPGATTSVTALDVAGIADRAVLIDHVATARRAEATRVTAELAAAGCGLSGCVLLGVGRSRVGQAGPSTTALRQENRAPVESRRHRRTARVAFTEFDDRTRAGSRFDTANGSPIK